MMRVAVALSALWSLHSALAQQITGVPGSPSATTTIEGNQLPPPPQKFEGKIERNTARSTPYWPARVVPPKGAPNVLLIMTDDTGFGVSSTFGGVIPTPNLDRVAANGLRYTNFNSTSLCSPTRAALITGRNHHSMGFGVVAEQSTGYPGYNSIMTRDKATIGRMLKDHGYWTSWFGRARCNACTAPSDARVDQEDQRHAPVRQGLERVARNDLRQPETARSGPTGCKDDALAGGPAEEMGPTHA